MLSKMTTLTLFQSNENLPSVTKETGFPFLVRVYEKTAWTHETMCQAALYT